MGFNIKMIGMGGVGTIVANSVSRYLNFSKNGNHKITLVDGDSYEPKNAERQLFQTYGNKAETKCNELATQFDNILYDSIPVFVNSFNSSRVIQDGDVVFMAVDNHKSRKIVSDRCKEIDNVILISGGNEFEDGNVQIYIKKEGRELTPAIDKYHPEIRNPMNNSPEDLSCEELQQSAPQLFFMNMMIATYMCAAFYNTTEKDKYHSDVYVDLVKMQSDSKVRNV
jgi:molybdopterin/thiamine biosynthesis adenylyltransferase